MTDRSGLDERPDCDRPLRARLARGFERRVTSRAWLGRAAGVGLCVAAVGFVGALVVAVGLHGELALVTRPPTMQVALALPYLVACLALATTVGTLSAWRHGYWTFPTRVHYTLLTLLGLAFVWQLSTIGFLPS